MSRGLREAGAVAAYVSKDLGDCEEGEIIEVTPAQAGNVLLLDEQNFGFYRRGRRIRGVGGPASAGVAVQLSVFADGHWFVVVDLNGVRGDIRASVRRLGTAAAVGAAPSSVTAEQLRR